MDEQGVIDYLREKHPGTFEGWDEFEIAIHTRLRRDKSGALLVSLYNEGTDDFVIDTHACFLIEIDSEGNEGNVRVGGAELNMEYNSAYIPNRFHGKEKT